ncbi:hypothetical protein RPATATE_0850 [Rickettsia parkeri str. Tate's Hell]|uniref:Uncharacterized protein n=1 Tax=Rickettsia parkeri str. Tate's Hell TaxID=1359189 RepID=A0ABR5DN16_RICPA|nr:hypothetical protein [Rickettsia parkeri]AFC74926.1 hypothetical protein MC1_04170 [Rickettsia parkeri str. Portsmouth]KJV93457.1 hypothetical protein RPAGB_0847 [Rickettsia parkeri str. Grand Bay]KJV96670.1 hypothetical protein RPAAT24_0072 [Rickettsia parkeri str. AT\
MFNWVYNKTPNIESLRKALEERIDFFSPLNTEEKERRAEIRLMRDADIENDKKSILEAIVKKDKLF